MGTTDVRSLVERIGLPHELPREVSHVETLAAADMSAGTDTAREIILRPVVTGADDKTQRVILTRIQAQSIRPENLRILGNDINHRDFELPLPPELVISDIPMIGDPNEGVRLVVRNRAARTVRLTLHAVVPGSGLQVSTRDLPAEALSGGGSGNSLYDATPGDKTWATAPAAGTPDTYSVPFTTASSLALMVQGTGAAVSVRISSDGGANYGKWIVLASGIHALSLDATDVQIELQAGAPEYQILAFA
ncbi:MAG: hypothetical protein WC273_12870 [Dehalococcoidia bacterium]